LRPVAENLLFFSLVVGGNGGVELSFFFGLFGGLLGGFGFGLGGFFGGDLGGLFLCLLVDNGVHGLAVKVHAGQAGALTSALAHVAEVVAADFAALGNLNLQNERAVQQKTLFDANTAGNTANGDAAGVCALAVGADHQTL